MTKKISDFKVGQKFRSEFDKMTRDLIKDYAEASGDKNPIHIREEVAKKAGLKGVIAHGLLSFGFIVKLLDKQVKGNGKVTGVYGQMRGKVRPGDTLITELEVTSIEDKTVQFDVLQKTVTKVEIEKDGEVVKMFEAGERGWISDKDREKGYLKQKKLDEGTLIYRVRPCILGSASIQINK
ncbi:MAG: MaoC family dehydratase [Promethearchaeia archaeon]